MCVAEQDTSNHVTYKKHTTISIAGTAKTTQVPGKIRNFVPHPEENNTAQQCLFLSVNHLRAAVETPKLQRRYLLPAGVEKTEASGFSVTGTSAYAASLEAHNADTQAA